MILRPELRFRIVLFGTTGALWIKLFRHWHTETFHKLYHPTAMTTDTIWLETDLREVSVPEVMEPLAKRRAITASVTTIFIPLNRHSLLLRRVFFCGGHTLHSNWTGLHLADISPYRLKAIVVAGGSEIRRFGSVRLIDRVALTLVAQCHGCEQQTFL